MPDSTVFDLVLFSQFAEFSRLDVKDESRVGSFDVAGQRARLFAKSSLEIPQRNPVPIDTESLVDTQRHVFPFAAALNPAAAAAEG